MLRNLTLSVCAVLLLTRPATVLAQEGGPDVSHVRVRFGPLMMNPTITVSNIGVDHNVFNDPPSRIPKEDFTFTLTPTVDLWLRAGPTWVTSTLGEQFNWYQEYSSERTSNNTYKLGWIVPGSRVNLKIDGTFINARERPGFEIDTRAQRTESYFTGTFEYKAWSKSYLGVAASRRKVDFDENEVFNGTNLSTALNMTSEIYGGHLRHQLTPLTTVTFSGSRTYDKFEHSPDRNANTTVVNMAAAFDPAALLKGNVSLGISNFRPDDPALPGYQGLVGAVDLTYVLMGSTRFAVTGSRSTRYSYDLNQPYYVQSQIGGSVAQQIYGPLDVQVRGDIAHLAYRDRAGVEVAVADRTDRVSTVGIGVGYHFGNDLRLSFNVDKNIRDTRVVDHQYERFLIGAALTYGF